MRIHFISIGGSAMHNLAIALHNSGHKVTGSDDIIFEPSKSRLKNKGLLPAKIGWDSQNITDDLEAVILGMHAQADNPELIRARELGLKIYSYPEYLYESSRDKSRVVIGGSHGKTTITSMILHALNFHKMDVDYMVGANLEGFETMVKISENTDYMVLEGDEYLSSALDLRPKFHLYKPNIALLSGIAWDHINVFPTFENYLEQFEIFIEKIEKNGVLVYNSEDKNIVKLVGKINNDINFLPYKTPKYRIEDKKYILKSDQGEFPLKIFGKHNLQNLEGARLICEQIGMNTYDYYEAMQSFTGASRRLELIKDNSKVKVYKDFAHSPSKVKASVNAIIENFQNEDKLVVLELHTYSSLTPEFLDLYKNTLDGIANPVVFIDKKIVENKRKQAIGEEQIINAFGKSDLIYFDDEDQFKSFVLDNCSDKKVLLFMSSGSLAGLDLENLPCL
jgi:UDP-N-acetylmuramate: L-alanyl-gamma-D-glutamyl-meso-diaminopimelate ligase